MQKRCKEKIEMAWPREHGFRKLLVLHKEKSKN